MRWIEYMENRQSTPELTIDDTIAAIATPLGRGGIGIVRISGAKAEAIAHRLFRPTRSKQNATGRGFLPHQLRFGHIVDPLNKKVVDEVLITYMPGPHSYTREDVVEVQSHAGTAVLHRILALIIESGARCAQPGEFTRRAFLNGRIDLSQAEAVADLICAETQGAAQLATEQLTGGLKRKIDPILYEINDICAEMEAHIEFPEDIEDITDYGSLRDRLINNVVLPVQKLIESYEEGRIIREGLRIVIAGRPNVGKSSLLNQLIEADKAIVTEIPGTTRDPVEAGLVYKGIAIRFSDTAGIRPCTDPVEAIGIRKSKEVICEADLVLLVLDAMAPGHPGDLEISAYCANQKTLLVVNKIDLVKSASIPGLPGALSHLPVAYISALNGTGLGALKEQVLHLCAPERSFEESSEILSNLRHKICLENGLTELKSALSGFDNDLPLDLLTYDIKRAGEEIRQISGTDIESGLLERIFSRFCIGK